MQQIEMMKLKRSREEDHAEDLTSMANCLMLLSGGGGGESGDHHQYSSNRVFVCKTCNRQFPSFQALGGHRASHKKPKLGMMNSTADEHNSMHRSSSPPKPKSHECSICGLEFPIGQALGGHMRRHRAATPLSLSPPHAPIVKKPNSRRILCLDLNLTPSENNFLLFGNINISPPAVDCFF